MSDDDLTPIEHAFGDLVGQLTDALDAHYGRMNKLDPDLPLDDLRSAWHAAFDDAVDNAAPRIILVPRNPDGTPMFKGDA